MGQLILTYESDLDIINDYVNNSNNRAANAFVRKYQKFVYSIALRFLKNSHDAEDISQEVFIKALNSLKSFRGESSLNTWLYRITSNLCKNKINKDKFINFITFNNNDNEIDFISRDLNPEQTFEKQEFEAKFQKAISSLPEKQRETFALRYFDDLPYEEISKVLGTSVGGLKANYFQAIKKLGAFMKEEK